MTFGEKLLKARLARNLSQMELAELAGVSERSIYSYEQTGTNPRKDILIRLADALNVTVQYLMDDKEDDPHSNLDQELYIANAKKEYGYKGAREASDVLTRAKALFAGGELNDEAKEVFFQSIMEVYLESKAEAREKFSPKGRASRKARVKNTVE